MNAKLTSLLNKRNAEFNWNEEEKTWCLSGTDSGNVWETDDIPADSLEQAEQDAVDWIEQVEEDEEYNERYPL